MLFSGASQLLHFQQLLHMQTVKVYQHLSQCLWIITDKAHFRGLETVFYP